MSQPRTRTALIALLSFPVCASAGELLYWNDYETPNVPIVVNCGNSLDQRGVDFLYGQPGFVYSHLQGLVPEAVTIDDQLGLYSDPAGIGGSYALGMLTVQEDRLFLTFDRENYRHFTIGFDLSSIDVMGCGGPFWVTRPSMRVILHDSPTGNGQPSDPILSEGVVSGVQAPDRWTFAWAPLTLELDASAAVSRYLTVEFDLTNGGYAVFDNLSIVGSDKACIEDTDLGTGLGDGLASGSTCGGGNDYDEATCGNGQSSEDVTFRWVAPATDTFTIDTLGSTFDTAVTVRDPGCAELFCDDDGGGNLLSRVVIDAVAGQELYLTVDGHGDLACGDYVLNVNQGCRPDADGDGVCDEVDLCVGDDGTGDSDGDGVCDDTDFVLEDPVATGGSPLALRVANAQPGSRVVFLVSLDGAGAGPCLPNGVCLDVRSPKQLGSATAAPDGSAELVVNVPPNATGRTVSFQAVWWSSGAGDKTEVDVVTVQ